MLTLSNTISLSTLNNHGSLNCYQFKLKILFTSYSVLLYKSTKTYPTPLIFKNFLNSITPRSCNCLVSKPNCLFHSLYTIKAQ